MTQETTGSLIRPRQRTLYWDRQTLAGSSEVYELELNALEFPENTLFLEHVFDPIMRKSTSRVIAASIRRLFVSDDLGENWRAIENPTAYQFLKCFSLRSGRHLLQADGDGGVHVFDEGWRYLGRRDAARHAWHGSWSIDQSAAGVIMFGEYADAGDDWRVLRSTDEGESWSVAFEVKGNATSHQQGEIRHFHTCQADPFEEGVWWLSSGDTTTQNRLWRSSDDGLSWREVSPDTRKLEGQVPEPRRHNVKRHTAELYTPSAVYWATDDNLGGRARLVRMARSARADGDLELLTELTRNEVRNLVQLEPHRFVAISEAKHEPACAQVFCVDSDGNLHARFDLPNSDGSRAGFCRSRSSKAALDGVFFSFSDGRLLERGPQMLKWQLRRSERAQGERSRAELQRRIEALKVECGGADKEVALLSARYAAHFQCNACNDALTPIFESSAHDQYEGILDPGRFKDAACHEYTCPHCDSRIRQRTARLLLEHHLQNRSGKVLAASESARQIRWFKQRYGAVVHVALHGDFGDPDILNGTDITRMPHVPSEQFALYWACCVLDYIPKLDDAAREAFRVLAPGGEFAFFIMPYRLVEDNTTCVVKHRNALAHEKYAQRGEPETGIPDCRFGARYVLDVFSDAGFSIRRVFLFDQLSRTSQAWFVATKPGERMANQST